MDHIFCPWRFTYVSTAARPGGCVLCRIGKTAPTEDESGFVVRRGEHHYLVLNIYPYNTGHLMIVPYEHVARLSEMSGSALAEMFALTARAESVLEDVYRPEGLNVGMNLGRSAGAGIADHIHMHVVPRWSADTNFITVSGETRVLPEDLHDTWKRLRDGFGKETP